MARPITRSKGRETESDLDAAATEAANKEDDRPDSRKKKKRRKQKKSKKNDKEEHEAEEEVKFPSQPLPARMSSESSEIESLGAIAAALDYVPARAKGQVPRLVW